MKKEGYTLIQPNPNLFTFVSVGKKGEILKGVFFEDIGDDVYNLALVDYDPISKQWSDEVVSDNGDILKIMVTVVDIIFHFLNKNHTKIVYFKGNSVIRQKLYNRIIQNYLVELSDEFVVWGNNENEREIVLQGKKYQSFYIYKK